MNAKVIRTLDPREIAKLKREQRRRRKLNDKPGAQALRRAAR